MEKVGNIIRQNVQFSYLCFDITDKMLVVKVAVFVAIHMKEYLKVSEVIDWQHPEIMKRAKQIASEYKTLITIAKGCFEWVRDEIYHSVDYQMNPVTWRASDVLKPRFRTSKSSIKYYKPGVNN